MPLELALSIAEKEWTLIIEVNNMTSYKKLLIADDLDAEPVQVLAKAQSIAAPSPTSLFLMPPFTHLIPMPAMPPLN